MAQQVIAVGAFVNDPSAESVHSAFIKVDAMTLEQFTALSLGGRQDIDMGTSPDTIRAAFHQPQRDLHRAGIVRPCRGHDQRRGGTG
jgi:hypothetical protein